MKFLKRTFVVLALAYAGLCVAMFLLQREFLYFPDRTPLEDLNRGPTYRLVETETEDGLRLSHFYRPASGGQPTMLLFHGNAGNIGLRMGKFDFLADHGVGSFLTEYRGYGGNPGSPTEEGLIADARSVVAWLGSNGVEPHNIFIFGASLGTGVATAMAAELAAVGTPVAGVILEAPYTSMAATAQYHYPWLPACWLTRDRYDSLARIADIDAPLVILHGQQDTTVPHSLGLELFEAASAPKTHISLPEVGHSYLLRADRAREAVRKLVLGTVN